MNIKDNLVESTLLALQGRLTLNESKVKKQEDIEVETDDVEVTVGDEKTVIDTDDTTVTVEKNIEQCSDGECDTTDDIVDVETFDDTPLSTSTEEDEDTETVEIPVEGEETIVPEQDLVTDTDMETEEDEDTETEEDDEEEEDKLENKQLKTEDIDPRQNETKMLNLIDSQNVDTNELSKELLSFLSDEDIQRFMEIYEYNNLVDSFVEESKQCSESCEKEECEQPITKFSSKTFNEAFTNMYKSKYRTIESFKTTKLSLKNNSIKVEGKLINVDGISKDINFELKKTNENKSFINYELVNYKGLLKENKNSTLKMVTKINKDNILECKYIITK